MKKEDLHIRILKYGAAHRDKGFTYDELKKDLNLTDSESGFLKNEVHGSDIVTQTGSHRIQGSSDFGNEIFILSFEARFKLLQYEALQEARSASTIAIVIGAVALLVSIGVGLYQIFTPQKVILTKIHTRMLYSGKY